MSRWFMVCSMDILEVGNVGDPWAPSPERMSQEEWRSHFSLCKSSARV
jgi:hypothetical protein